MRSSPRAEDRFDNSSDRSHCECHLEDLPVETCSLKAYVGYLSSPRKRRSEVGEKPKAQTTHM